MSHFKQTIERGIFSSRWFLIPFYFGLLLALFLYAVYFLFVEFQQAVQCVHIFNQAPIFEHSKEAEEFWELLGSTVLMGLLSLVDMAMIANLVKMIITGSYNSFVDKGHGYKNDNISSGALKVKMSTSLIGVSSIHLLKSFIGALTVPWDILHKQLFIHATFLIGALILAVIDHLHAKTAVLEEKAHSKQQSTTH